MKKILALILALILVFALAACGEGDKPTSPSDTNKPSTDTPSTDKPSTDAPSTDAPSTDTPATPDVPATPDAPAASDVTDAPVDILKAAWGKVADDSKFPVGGGDAEHTDFEGPGLVVDKAFMGSILLIPEAEQAKIDAAGSFMHMMNANSFTCGAYHLTNAADVDAFAQTMRDTIANNQWMCGFPELMYIAKVGTSNVVVMFGLTDAVNPVKTGLQEAYGDAVTVIVDEPISVG